MLCNKAAKKTLLSVQDVRFKYSQAPIFDGLQLAVDDGEFLGVVGPSGCGKSTLLRLVAGLLRPTSGRILLADSEVDGPNSRVGMVFQADTLLPWRTALRNVQLGIESQLPAAEVAARGRELLSRVGLEGAKDKYPHQLSGGMRQRVNLARALAHDPTILLMDEPFAALDAQTRDAQQAHLLEVWQRDDDDKTVVFVTHQIDEALFLADRVVVLGSTPRGVVSELAVSFPRPRSLAIKTTAEFSSMVEVVRSAIQADLSTGHLDTREIL